MSGAIGRSKDTDETDLTDVSLLLQNLVYTVMHHINLFYMT